MLAGFVFIKICYVIFWVCKHVGKIKLLVKLAVVFHRPLLKKIGKLPDKFFIKICFLLFFLVSKHVKLLVKLLLWCVIL
jgi:hypothetical protein